MYTCMNAKLHVILPPNIMLHPTFTRVIKRSVITFADMLHVSPAFSGLGYLFCFC